MCLEQLKHATNQLMKFSLTPSNLTTKQPFRFFLKGVSKQFCKKTAYTDEETEIINNFEEIFCNTFRFTHYVSNTTTLDFYLVRFRFTRNKQIIISAFYKHFVTFTRKPNKSTKFIKRITKLSQRITKQRRRFAKLKKNTNDLDSQN